MYDYFPTVLSAADHSRLQRMMRGMIGSRSPLAALVRHKLGTATVVPNANARADLVSSGRKVRYRIGRVRSDERVLVWAPADETDEVSLSLLTPDGLALLGLAVGRYISFKTDDHRTQTFLVQNVGDRHRTRSPQVASGNASRPNLTAFPSRSPTDSARETAFETAITS